MSRRRAYSPPTSELPGYKTLVTEDSEKGLPGTTSLPSSEDSGGKQDPEHIERALPMPPKRRNLEVKKQEFNTPYRPDDKPVQPRTRSTPGEEYDHPYMEQGTGIIQRRPGITAGLTTPYPSATDRQRDQKGDAKRFYRRNYRKNRGKILQRARKRYLKMKHRPAYKRDVVRRRDHPEKFERRPSGGFSSPAERAREQREEAKKVASLQQLQGLWFNDLPLLSLDVDSDTGAVRFTTSEGSYDLPLDSFVNQVDFESRGIMKGFFEYVDTLFEYTENGDDAWWLEEDTPSMVERVARKYAGDVMLFDRKPPEDRDGAEMDIPNGGTTWVVPTHTQPNVNEKPDKQIPAYDLNIDHEVMDNPGSARVIPDNHDFVNNKGASAVQRLSKIAVRMAEIVEATSPKVRAKSVGLRVVLSRVNRKSLSWRFTVQGSDEPYTVLMKALPKGPGIRNLKNTDVLVSCSCPFWRWQGPEYHAKQKGYLYGTPVGTASTPDIKDPNREHLACKHTIAVLAFAENYRLPGRDWKLGSVLIDLERVWRIAARVAGRYNRGE